MPPRNRQNPSIIDAQIEAQKKTIKILENDLKTGLGFFILGAKSDPEWHPKNMKKSTPKKYAKMMAKGSKQYGTIT